MFILNVRALLHQLINQRYIKSALTNWRWFVRLYFNFLYRKEDPYRVHSPEEKEKFDHAFRLLGDRRFRKGLEIGCGEGRNTWRLAKICQAVLAVDISDKAIRRARQFATLPNVIFQVFDLVTDPLPGRFDYIFCSEVLYYLYPTQLDPAIEKIIKATNPGGIIHLLHSRSLKDDTSGLDLKEFGARTIHERFLASDELTAVADEKTPMYRITILQKNAS